MCMLGTFSQYSTIHQNSVVKVDDDLPLDKAVLVGCGVPTGWGSAVYAADVRPGETVIGPASAASASTPCRAPGTPAPTNLIAVDPLENKREKAMELGATHAVATIEEAAEFAQSLTRGNGADKTIVTAGIVTEEIVTGAFNATGKAGTVVLTGLNKFTVNNVAYRGRSSPCSRRRSKARCSATATRPRTSPCCWACTRAGTEAGRDHYPHLHARGGQQGLRRPARGQERARRLVHDGMTDRSQGPGSMPGPWARFETLTGALAGTVVGRTREIELLLAGLDCGAHVVLEGPPGTGKTTLLRAIAETSGVPFVFVEGNAELTPSRLLGHFDPSQVLAKGYVPETFVDGPLIEALRDGGLLYVEEVNRVPEETLNVLITVMSEGELHVPRLGRVRAADTFRLVAAMNPFDTVGTARISAAIYDRVCRIVMGYQARDEENDIVARRSPSVPESWRDQVVDLVRRTRGHPDVRVGSSVRGAIDLVRMAVLSPGSGAVSRPPGRPATTPRWSRCPAGSACASPADAPRNRSSRTCTVRCSASRPSRRTALVVVPRGNSGPATGGHHLDETAPRPGPAQRLAR